MIALFSGRFDPPNLGHIMTIGKLLDEYYHVIVVVLDYKGREACKIKTVFDIFNTALGYFSESRFARVKLISHNSHFGEITKCELKELIDNLKIEDTNYIEYVGGNKKVNDHIRKLGFLKVRGLPRIVLNDFETRKKYRPDDQYMFESTKIRKKMARGESLEQQYNIGGSHV